MFELELVVPLTDRLRVSFERLLERHGVHGVHSYRVQTASRTIQHIQISTMNGERLDSLPLGALLADIESNCEIDSSPHAASPVAP